MSVLICDESIICDECTRLPRIASLYHSATWGVDTLHLQAHHTNSNPPVWTCNVEMGVSRNIFTILILYFLNVEK